MASEAQVQRLIDRRQLKPVKIMAQEDQDWTPPTFTRDEMFCSSQTLKPLLYLAIAFPELSKVKLND